MCADESWNTQDLLKRTNYPLNRIFKAIGTVAITLSGQFSYQKELKWVKRNLDISTVRIGKSRSV